MTSVRSILEISGTLLALVLAAMAIHGWMAEHDDELRMQATIATQKQLLVAADAREHDRDVALKDTLAQIEALKRSVQTPAEILRDLPKYLPLPQPITMAPAGAALALKQGTAVPEKQTCSGAEACSADAAAVQVPPSKDPSHPTRAKSPTSHDAPVLPDAPIPSAQIPAADLKPLYDYVQDCRACQAQLATAKLNAADDAAKLAAVTRERDAALTAVKGGTFWRRLRRSAVWFAAGAGAGAIALCGTGHCR